jgi:hypothetical protein
LLLFVILSIVLLFLYYLSYNICYYYLIRVLCIIWWFAPFYKINQSFIKDRLIVICFKDFENNEKLKLNSFKYKFFEKIDYYLNMNLNKKINLYYLWQ